MSVDFIDELEALQSVYSDLQIDLLPQDTIEATTTVNRRAQKSSNTSSSKSSEIVQAERIYGIIHLTCTPRSSSTNFVSTDIEISISALYPAVLPKFKVLKTSGINDDGKEIEILIQKFLDDSPLDECLLFQLICLVFDFLDDCSIGECSICAEAIVPFDFQGDSLSNGRMKQLEGKLYGLKTPCCHCFHMTCLSHWASLSIVKKEVKKPAKQWETDRDDIAMKSMEGQIKSTETEIASLNEQKEKLKSDIIDSETELNTALLEIQKIVDREKEMEELADAEADKPMSSKNKNNANIHSKNRKTNLICNVKDTEMAALKVTIKSLRSKLSLLVTEGAKRKNSNERREASEEVISLRECLSKTEQQLDDVKQREETSYDSITKIIEIRLKDLRVALESVADKLIRTEKKLSNFISELSVLKNIEASKTSEKCLNRTFPCAYCRTSLSSNTCVDSGDKNEKAVFNYFLESAIAAEMMSVEGVLND